MIRALLLLIVLAGCNMRWPRSIIEWKHEVRLGEPDPKQKTQDVCPAVPACKASCTCEREGEDSHP